MKSANIIQVKAFLAQNGVGTGTNIGVNDCASLILQFYNEETSQQTAALQERLDLQIKANDDLLSRLKEQKDLQQVPVTEEEIVKQFLLDWDEEDSDNNPTRMEKDLKNIIALSRQPQFKAGSKEIPLILNKSERNELENLRNLQSDSSLPINQTQYDRLQELAKKEFGFNMGYDNPYGNLFKMEDGKVIQGGLNGRIATELTEQVNSKCCGHPIWNHMKSDKTIVKICSQCLQELTEQGNEPIIEINPIQYPDTEADGYVFCGKCGKMK